MTQEEFEDLKDRIFRDIESIKSNHRRQPLARRSATITTESQRVGILPTTTQQASTSTQAAASSLRSSSSSRNSSLLPLQHHRNSSSLLSSHPVRAGLGPPGSFQGHPNIPKQLFSCKLFQFPSPNITVQYKYLSQKNTNTTPNMKQITHGTTHNQKGHIEKN